MSSQRRSPGTRPAVRGGALAALAIASFVALVAADAWSATFYKWVDKDGGVHYGDKPPKGVEARPVEVDPDAHVTAGSPAPATGAGLPGTAPGTDILTQRRETRERLETNLAKARERLDLAQKALAEFTGTGEGEQQYIQREVSPTPPTGPTPTPLQGGGPGAVQGGMLGMAPGQNCRQVKTSEGKTVLICGGVVPSEDYYKRLAELENEVKIAQQAVDDAEVAYRKGVD